MMGGRYWSSTLGTGQLLAAEPTTNLDQQGGPASGLPPTMDDVHLLLGRPPKSGQRRPGRPERSDRFLTRGDLGACQPGENGPPLAVHDPRQAESAFDDLGWCRLEPFGVEQVVDRPGSIGP